MSQIDPRASFFAKRKTRVLIADWKPKMNAEGEKRVRIDLQIPLTDKNREGTLPPWLFNPLSSMERTDSAEVESKLSVTLEGETMEIWATDKSPERMMLLASCTLQDFSLKQITRDKQTYPALLFNTNIKRDWKLLTFLDKHEDCFVWIEFTPTEPQLPEVPTQTAQMKLGEEPQEEATEEDQQAESVANVGAFFGKGDAASPADEMPVQTAERASAVEEILEESYVDEHGTDVTEKVKAINARSNKQRRPRGFSRPTNPSAVN